MQTEETGISREHAAAEKMLGKDIDGRFRITTLVGSGAMGNVFSATHLQMDAIRALKILHPWLMMDARSCKRFLQEARAISSLDHPNVVKVYACGQSDDIVYIAMDFLQGESLADLIEKGEKFSIERATDMIIQAARGLSHAHENSVVHRDVKPSNIMLCIVGDSTILKVVDFGVAKILETDATTAGQALTGTGAAIGTPYYMSPEQCANDSIDARSDIYSLGCVLYQLVCGRLPVEGDSVFAAMYSHIQGDIIPVGADVPVWMREIILKCLAKDRENRFQSMGELIAALESRTAGNTRGSASTKRRPVMSKSQLKMSAACVGIALLVGSGVVLLQSHPEWTGAKAQELQQVRNDIESYENLVARTDRQHHPHKYWQYRHDLLKFKTKELQLSTQEDPGESWRLLLKEYIELAKIPQGGHDVALLFEAAKLPGLSKSERAHALVTALQSGSPPDANDGSVGVRSYNRRLLDAMKAADFSLLPQMDLPTLFGRLSEIVQTFIRIQSYDDAEDGLALWMQLARASANDSVFHAHGLALLAKVKGQTGREQEAMVDEQRALLIVEAKTSPGHRLPLDHQLAAAGTYSEIGHREIARKEYKLAFAHHSKAVESLASNISQTRHQRSDAYLYAGVALHCQKDLKGALQQYNKALAVWNEVQVNDSERTTKIAQLKKVIGDAYASEKQSENALKAYRDCEILSVHAKNPEVRTNYQFVSILAQETILRELGRLDEAARTIARAEPIVKTPDMQADYNEHRGTLCSLRKEFVGAANYFSEEAATRIKAGAPAAAICLASLRAADAFRLIHNDADAGRCRDDALKYAKLSGDPNWVKEAESRFK